VAELERELRALGRELAFPPTPDIATIVDARIEAEQRPSPNRAPARSVRTLALAGGIALLLAGTVLAAVPAARDAASDLLGLDAVTIERTAGPPPRPTEPRSLALGSEVSLAEASARADFGILVPREPGRPDFVHVRLDIPGGEVSLAYRARPPGLPEARQTGLGLLVTELRGDLAPGYLKKVTFEGARVRRLTVGGHRAIWIAGAPHFVGVRSPDGSVSTMRTRIAGNVLLVGHGRRLIRLEGEFPLTEATRIARSLEPSGTGAAPRR
jgi:hypothetical protein